MPDVDPDLIALHNTSEEGIRASIKLGGIPVPSLGITKKDIAFTGFGDITLIADKATIDPMADPRNRLYSSDVYSPRQPRPFQSMVRGGRDIISKKIKALLPSGFESWSEIAPGERAYDKVVEKGDDNVAKTHRNMIGSPDVQAAFLTENGIQVPRLMKEPDIFNRVLSREQLSDSRLDELSKNSSNLYDFLQTKEGIEVGDEIRKMYIENSSSNYQNVSPERLMRMNVLIEESYGAPGTPFPFRDANSIVDDIRTVLKGGKKVDSFGIREWVRQEIKPREAEFAKWVDNLVSNVFEPNQKIIKGSKKLPYTLENLTEAMSGKVKAQEGGLTYSLGKARSESAVQFRSLEQAREAKGSIVGSVEMESFKKAQQDQFNRLVDMLTPFDKYQSRNSFDRLDDLSAAIGKIAKRPSSAESVLASIDFTGVPADVLSDVKRFATSLKSAPTEYFEAKPQRAVGLDEFKAAIVPESTSQDVIDALRNSGLYVEKYTDNAKRIAIVERVSGERNLRFMPSDAEYLSAVEAGDTAKAQELVDQAAKAAGYTVGPVYHGTSEKFWSFDPKQRPGDTASYGEGLMFFTDSQKLANEYASLGTQAARKAEADVVKATESFDAVASEMFPNASLDYLEERGFNIANEALNLKQITRDQYEKFQSVSDNLYKAKARKENLSWPPSERRIIKSYLKIERPVKKEVSGGPALASWDIHLPALFDKMKTSEGDGFIASGVYDSPYGSEIKSTIYAVRDPNQIKSADPITRDDAGNIIPLSKRFQQSSADIRYMPAPVPDPSIPGAYSMSGYRILPGKTKSKLRVYSPSGSLVGVVGSVDDAQRMIQKKLQ